MTGNGLWDAFGTLAIGILLVFIAAFLAVEMKSLILGEAASPEDLAKIRAAIEDGDSERIIHIKTCTWVLRRFWWRRRFAFMMLTLVVRWLMR